MIVDGANYVRFEDLTFKHTCWNRPLHKGHVTLQGGFPLVDAYKLKENPGLAGTKDWKIRHGESVPSVLSPFAMPTT